MAAVTSRENNLKVIFTLRHRRHVGGRKQKVSHKLLLFVHQQLYIAALLFVSLETGCTTLIVEYSPIKLSIIARTLYETHGGRPCKESTIVLTFNSSNMFLT